MGTDRRGRSFGVYAGAIGCFLAVAVWIAASAPGVAYAATAPEYVSSFGPDGTEATEFERAGPVAVDQGLHFVYVADVAAGALYRFDTEGNPAPFSGPQPYISGNKISGLSFSGGLGSNQVAVDSSSHRIYVTSGNAVRGFDQDGEPVEFTEGPAAGSSELAGRGGTSEVRGVAVDRHSAIYMVDTSEANQGENIRIFAPTGAELTVANTTTSGEPSNLTVDQNGSLYLVYVPELIKKLVPSKFPVSTATVYSAPQAFAPESRTVTVDPAVNDVYSSELGGDPHIARYSESGQLLSTFAGEGEEGESPGSEGVGVDAATTKVFVSYDPASGPSLVRIFQPVVAAPSIEAEFVRNVSGDSARINADINPNSRDTSYHFEYGLEDCQIGTCVSVPIPEGAIGNGHDAVRVGELLTGLAPGTTYHYRVIATNELGSTPGPDRVFVTQAKGIGVGLMDSRVWEMVSPSNKFGGMLVNAGVGPMQAAADGDGIVYQSVGSIVSGAEGNRAAERSAVLGVRSPGGWSAKDLTPPHEKPTVLGPGNEYVAFDPDLSSGLLEPRDDNPLSPLASGKTPYLRSTATSEYLPLVTDKEGAANVPAGTGFGGSGKEVFVSGATDDLGHVIVRTAARLVEDAQPLGPSALYEWSNGQIEAVSFLPESEGGGLARGLLGSGLGSIHNAVSKDGSHVYWSVGEYEGSLNNLPALYRRDLNSDETVRIDVPEAGVSGPGAPSTVFLGASADGQVVYFSDTQQLTEDASPDGRDLYRCEFSELDPSSCSLTNITGATSSAGESGNVLGLLSASTDDGSTAYFVAKGVLDSTPNSNGEEAVSEEPNLYLWNEGEGVRYLATLSSKDSNNWGFAPTGSIGISARISAASSPSGRYLAFASERSLSGYDNRDAESGALDQEVFVYDAVADQIDCVSCNPTGARPDGAVIHVDVGFAKVDPQRIWQDRSVAAVLPEARRAGAISGSEKFSFYRPRAVFDNGRVFFNAADSLVPADSNGEWDVYQYQPDGVGSCSDSNLSASAVRQGPGCVGLVSSGTGDEESGFLDASATGNDAFFLTPARLSVLDKDETYDVYDARVNGTTAVINPPSECAGETCQPSVPPPNDPTPASEAFRGPGNPVTCPKGKKKVKRDGKVRCVRKKSKKQKSKHRRAGKTRRAHR